MNEYRNAMSANSLSEGFGSFVVLDTLPGVNLQSLDPLRVLQTVTGGNLPIVERWQNKEFGPLDFLYSKVSKAFTTSAMAFAILAVINPPFVQEECNGDNRLEQGKSCTYMLCISYGWLLFFS